MTRLFLDANVLFTAAHNPDGKAALVIELAANGYWEVVTSNYAIEEARRNRLRKYPTCAETFDRLLVDLRVVPSGRGGECPIDLLEKDRPIFEAALLSGATHLLTGDVKDFGSYMNDVQKTQGIKIQTISNFFNGS